MKAIIFDMDGTITRPWFDFNKVRFESGLPEPLLENMMALPPGPQRDRAYGIMDRVEQEGVEASELNDGARELIEWLRKRSIPCGILTRNSRPSLEGVMRKHNLTFDVLMSRDDGPIKPNPESIQMICAQFSVQPHEALMVGDYKFDVIAGQKAGTKTALLTNGDPPSYLDEIAPDYVIDKLTELRRII